MNKFIHWNSVTLLVTIVGLLIPLWIWRADVDSKSLQFHIKSQVNLQPEASSNISGLQVSIDGTPLESPHLTVLELTNTGDRPISSADFEVPLELQLQKGAAIVRASVMSVSPKDVKPIVTTKPEYLELKPMLLNPRDSVTFSILSSGLQPIYSTNSRITGVSSVPIIYETSKTVTWINNALLLIASLLMFAISSIVSDAFKEKSFVLRKRAIVLIVALTSISGFVYFLDFLDGIGVHDFWLIVLAFIPFIFATTVVSVFWNWPASPSAK